MIASVARLLRLSFMKLAATCLDFASLLSVNF
jgi:hypothetical protein